MLLELRVLSGVVDEQLYNIFVVVALWRLVGAKCGFDVRFMMLSLGFALEVVGAPPPRKQYDKIRLQLLPVTSPTPDPFFGLLGVIGHKIFDCKGIGP